VEAVLLQARVDFVASLRRLDVMVGTGGCVVVDPECRLDRVLQPASDVLSGWPEDSAYDLVLLQLAAATAAVVIDPSPATGWSHRAPKPVHAAGELRPAGLIAARQGQQRVHFPPRRAGLGGGGVQFGHPHRQLPSVGASHRGCPDR
jgi:hypothetical protein